MDGLVQTHILKISFKGSSQKTIDISNDFRVAQEAAGCFLPFWDKFPPYKVPPFECQKHDSENMYSQQYTPTEIGSTMLGYSARTDDVVSS